jgi:hypothetical protein
MNRTILAGLIGMMYRAPAGEGDGGAGGTGAGGTGQQQQQTQVDAPGARAYLADFVSDPESLKTMPDADVLKLHGKVAGSTQKHFATLSEKQKQERLNAAKDLKLEAPQGSKLHQTDVERIAAYARSQGLSVDEAKAMLAENEKAVTAHEARQIEAANEQRSKWVTEWQADPALGGEKLVTTQKNIQRVIDRFMPAPLQAKLKESGLGAYPDFVRMLNNVGAAMAEDGGINGGQGGGQGEVSAADKLYGTKSQ